MSKEKILSSNLQFDKELNHEKGFCSFSGQTAMQNYKAFSVIWDLLELASPKTIIEIGTAAGGFSRFLKLASDDLKLNAKVITYDVNHAPQRKALLDLGIEYREEDCFGADSSNNLSRLKRDIQSDGTCIVFCDGGHKITEFNMLSDFIKNGDFILAHDYSYSKDHFEKNMKGKNWNFCEITYSSIEESVLRNNLNPFNEKKLNDVAWACFTK